MSPAEQRHPHELAATVHEVLTAMFAPELRRQLLDEALTLEGCAEIPGDPVRVRAFVEGPLRLVIKRRVGQVMASFLLETLGPVFDPSRREPRSSFERGLSEQGLSEQGLSEQGLSEQGPLASDLPVFGEDDDDATWGAERDTDVYDAGSLRRLRHRLRRERPQSGAQLRRPIGPNDDEI